MLNLGKKIVKLRYVILALSILLLIPCGITYLNTRINYDILSYLPKNIDTMKGQDILVDEFGTGAFSVVVVDDMKQSDLAKLEDKISKVDHVKAVLGYDSFKEMSIPMDAVPKKVKDALVNEKTNSTIFMVLFDTSTSADETLEGIEEIRSITKGQCFLSGMSSVVYDIAEISKTEAVAYVILAVIMTIIVLTLTMDSFLIPVFFLISIGFAIVYNLGTNYISGEISFITQALTAVLQLATTLDYSIFLWHSYQDYRETYPNEKERAMAHAISNTIGSVTGSSTTTIAGFVAMCFMVTILPSLILVFDGAIQKTRHKAFMPDLGKIGKFVANKYVVFIIVFAVVMVPALYGYKHTEVYYDLAGTLPKKLNSVKANQKLEKDFNTGATHMILSSSELSSKDTSMMIDEVEKVDGVKTVLGLDNIVGPAIPKDVIPNKYKEVLDSGKYKLIMIMSEYKTASDEVNNQVTEIQDILKKYDKNGMLIGEAPCTKDLITITDTDFNTVSAVSIVLVFIIIAIALKSISLPVILVLVIEAAIYINMAIPAYTHTTLPFIASIVIGTIQLGATVDYAILMSNKYKKLRRNGAEKKDAIIGALNGSVQSIFVSAMSFFAATFGVGLYSSIDMISSICILLARGAIISFIMVSFILPAFFMIFDKVIINTSLGFKPKKVQE